MSDVHTFKVKITRLGYLQWRWTAIGTGWSAQGGARFRFFAKLNAHGEIKRYVRQLRSEEYEYNPGRNT